MRISVRKIAVIATILAACLTSGILYFAQRDPVSEHEQALRELLGDAPENSQTRVELSQLLEKSDKWQEAMVLLQDGLRTAPDDVAMNRQLAAILAERVEAHQEKKKIDTVVKYLQKVIDSGQAGKADYLAIAKAFCWAEKYYKAMQAYKEAVKRDPDDTESERNAFYCLYRTGQYEQSRIYFKELTDREPANSWAWEMLGVISYHLGDYEEAAAYLTKAIEVEVEPKSGRLQDTLTLVRQLQSTENREENFTAHYCLAQEHEKVSRDDRAFAEYNAAVKIDTGGKAYLARAYANIADFLIEITNYEKALEYLEKAIEINTSIDNINSLAFNFQSMTSIYYGLAFIHKDQQDHFKNKAIEAKEKQLEYCRSAGNKHLEIHAICDLAQYLYDRDEKETDRVKELRQLVSEYLSQEGPVIDCAIAEVFSTEGYFLGKNGDYAGAEEHVKRAADYYENSGYYATKHAPRLYNELGQIALKREEYDRGIEYAEHAVQRLNGVRAHYGADEFRRKIGGDLWQSTFQTLVSCAYLKQDKRAVFNYCERYKAQALLELLGTNAVTQNGRDRLLSAKNESNENNTQEITGETNQPSETRDLSIEQDRYSRLPENTASARRTIRSFGQARSCRAAEIQQLAGEFTFVGYNLIKDKSMAVVLTKDSIDTIELEFDADTLSKAIEAFRDGLGLKQGPQRDLTLEPAKSVAEAREERKMARAEAAEKLWDLLIAPIKERLNTPLLYISPDGMMNYLPFEALEKNGRFLVEEYAIAYAPSATVLKYCMDKEHTRRESVLALGNPNLQNPAFRLINAEDEVQSLREFFPNADIFTGDSAAEGIAVELAPYYDVLHFACHGELNDEEPMLTALRLSPDEHNDGYLHAGEIFDLELNASLVVLSACNSGLGELHSGNELMGLTRSFLYAGAPSIVASLWTVDDRSTAALMRTFYRNLPKMNKAEALRQAKLETMQTYPDPFHWAAFCLQGDYR